MLCLPSNAITFLRVISPLTLLCGLNKSVLKISSKAKNLETLSFAEFNCQIKTLRIYYFINSLIAQLGD